MNAVGKRTCFKSWGGVDRVSKQLSIFEKGIVRVRKMLSNRAYDQVRLRYSYLKAGLFATKHSSRNWSTGIERHSKLEGFENTCNLCYCNQETHLCSPMRARKSPVDGPRYTSKSLVIWFIRRRHCLANCAITTAWFSRGLGRPHTAT